MKINEANSSMSRSLSSPSSFLLTLWLYKNVVGILLSSIFRTDAAYSDDLMSWSLLSPLNRKLAPLEIYHDNWMRILFSMQPLGNEDVLLCLSSFSIYLLIEFTKFHLAHHACQVFSISIGVAQLSRSHSQSLFTTNETMDFFHLSNYLNSEQTY